VLDGELVVWTGARLDFDALQQRMVNTAATVVAAWHRRSRPRWWSSTYSRSTASLEGTDWDTWNSPARSGGEDRRAPD
jgi:hypothetical protein